MMIASTRSATTERIFWLAELAEAINKAEHLAWRLGYAEGENADARALYTRLGALRTELDTLRNGWDAVPTELDPFWTSLFPPR
jgi:hypothetical protein